MVKSRSRVPTGHGEVLLRPPFEEWPGIASANAGICDSWDFEVGGMPIRSLRRTVRRILIAEAAATNARLGLHAKKAPEEPDRVAVTGHQPDLYHTGAWAKQFLLQRLCDEIGATGLDLVVDTDTFDSIGVTFPCLGPEVRRCRQDLSVGLADTCFACAEVPSATDIEAFCEATSRALALLPAPSVGKHFARFCDSLREAASIGSNLAELLTGARRRFEGELTDYLELPVTVAAKTEPFIRFASDILLNAERFARIHNEELAEHRRARGKRSAAHPFPDLDTSGDSVEVPFWLLDGKNRSPARVKPVTEGLELLGSDGSVVLSCTRPEEATAALMNTSVVLAPRALTLTLFARTFLADLFIHGVGGERYEDVTDAIVERWWGVSLPPFVVATLTMHLPLGAQVVNDEELASIDRRLRRLKHNPDEALGEVEFDSSSERRRALSLAEEKRRLIEAMEAPEADKKALGERIRSVNVQLSEILEPLAGELVERKELLESKRAESEVLTDRTYPFCFWSPAEVADKVW